MAEFAISLPILLLLVFGVIEFGRVFQAWVTLQNSARAAARYASTGQFNEARYVVNENQEDDPNSIVHCTLNTDDRGAQSDLAVEGDTIHIYTGDEGLFATWYDGEDCEPNRIDHQDMRKDIARILSITDEARRGAAGLALGPDPLATVSTQNDVQAFLYKQWERPLPGGTSFDYHEGWDQPSYFDVMICSSRGTRNDFSTSFYDGVTTRFYTALDPEDFNGLTRFDGDFDQKNDTRTPVCVLNEQPPPGAGTLQNAGVPWLDAGGPGDAVTVVVTFNHPLITPLGLAPYIQLQARRAAVNEAFRAAEATGALQGGAAITADLNTPPVARLTINNPNLQQPGNTMTVESTDLDPVTGAYPVLLDGSGSRDDDGPNGKPVTYIYSLNLGGGATLELAHLDYSEGGETPNPAGIVSGKTPDERRFYFTPGTYEVILTVIDSGGLENTNSISFTIKLPDPPTPPTDTPVPTGTSTPIPPFTCDRLSATDLSFFNNRVWIQIKNENAKSTVLTRVNFQWHKIGAFPNMYVSGMSLDGILHWRGQDYTPPTDTNADVPTPANVFLEADRTVPGQDTVTWEGVFNNGPAPIQDASKGIFWMTPYDFAGTTFTLDNPEGGAPCVIPLDLATPTPSPTVNPNKSPTPTWTPSCAGNVTIRFESFETFGVVRLLVTNQWTVPATFTDFAINWVKRKPAMELERVVAGGQNAADLTNGTLVWQAASGQDQQPPTVSGSTTATSGTINNYVSGSTGPEGTWLTNYSFPPNTTTNLWIKFGVTNSPPDTAFGMSSSDLNGSWFELVCGTPNPEPGGGVFYGGDNRITISQEPSPFPSNTPRPTDTPKPTFTPSKTYTPGPPTNTPKPPTPTKTPKPTNTPLPTQPPTPSDPDEGGINCGSDTGC